MIAGLRALVGGAALILLGAAPLHAQRSPPVAAPPTAPAPPPFRVDARARPQRFTLDFTLGEEGRSALIVELRPADGTRTPVLRELSLRFDPFEGAHWHWTLRAADVAADTRYDAAGRSSTSTPLTQIPEPKGLHYQLTFDFHAGGGLSVAFPDGAPLLAAQFGGTTPLEVTLHTSGAVSALAVGAVEAVGDGAWTAALAATTLGLTSWLPATAREVDPLPPFSLGQLARTGDALPEVPPLAVVRPLEPRQASEGRLTRFILEPRPNVEIPVVVIEPATANELVVVACGAPLGKADPVALAHLAGLAAHGTVVVAFDLLDGGERRVNQSFDDFALPELQLVGSSPQEVAIEELRQVWQWALGQPFASAGRAERAALHLDAVAVRTLRFHSTALGSEFTPLSERSVAASATLADIAVFGDEYLRARYDSDLYRMAVERRETCAPPDAASFSLAQRCDEGPLRAIRTDRSPVLHYDPASATITAIDLAAAPARLPVPPTPIRTVAASDFGPRAALELARATALANDAPCFGLGGSLSNDAGEALPLGSMTLLLERAIENAIGPAADGATTPAGRVRLVADGAWGVAALLAAAAQPEHVTSLTVFDALPSFELLLRRPPDAVRAEERFGLLTQGLPAALYVEDAFSRYDLEEVALALRAAGVTVDWRQPVDALRRPLDRYGRLAMWPRVRHAEQPPR